MQAEGLYQPFIARTQEPAVGGRHPSRQESDTVTDPHDASDLGSSDWLDDPVIWLVAIAALATGVVGIKFNWFKAGASVSVKMSDELAAIVGQTLFTIVGIIVFKVAASKIEIPGVQKVAAAI